MTCHVLRRFAPSPPLSPFSPAPSLSLQIRPVLAISNKMSNQSHTQKTMDSAPASRPAIKFVTAATIGGALLIFSGLTLTVTLIALVIATPLLVIVSPILFPAGIALFLVVTGFLLSGGFGIAALLALSWIYSYVAGKHPPGADQLDYARTKLANKAREAKDRAKDYGQHVQHKTQEVMQGNA